MKKYQVRFSKNGKTYEPVIEAKSDRDARELVKLQYGKEITILGSREV